MHAAVSKSNCGSYDSTKAFSHPTQFFFSLKPEKSRKLTAKNEHTDLDRLESVHIIICKVLQNMSSSKPKGA